MTSDPTATRWYPQTVGGAVYLLVVTTALTGLVITTVGPWRAGVAWIGISVVLGSLARLLLPERQAGMLRVRRKGPDVVLMLLTGVALVVLSVVVPDQRG